MSFRLFRMPQPGEFFVVFGDCAQGGADSNFVQFMSADRIDVPLVIQLNGVAAGMTPHLHRTLVWLADLTGVAPVVALERQNGGASEMERLRVLNRHEDYTLYQMKKFGSTEGETESEILGWDTNSATRPKMLGDYKQAFDAQLITIYDPETIKQHNSFIINKKNRPEAAPNSHDDAVMSMAGVWQLFQTEQRPVASEDKAYVSAPATSQPAPTLAINGLEIGEGLDAILNRGNDPEEDF